MRLSLKCSWRTLALVMICSTPLQAAVPAGWYMAGSRPQEYDCSRDSDTLYQGLPSAYVKSKPGVKTTGFGTLMQDFDASEFRGKRVQFSANVKAEDVTSWAGLWMRIDSRKGGKNTSVAFDNMQQRPIKGTIGWQEYSVVLDVPQEATGIFLGILLDGPGAVWMNGGKFEVVGSNVPTTDMTHRPEWAGPTGAAAASVTKTSDGVYHVILPANLRWGASIANPTGQEVTIFNAAGKVCWDPGPNVKERCNGPEGSGRIPLRELGQPEDFLAPDKAAGALISKSEAGKTYFSINDRGAAFEDNEGFFEFDVKLETPQQK